MRMGWVMLIYRRCRNEPGALAPAVYIKAMRAALDKAGFTETKLVALDSGEGGAAQYVAAMATDGVLRQAVHAFGFHGGPTEAGGATWLPAYRRRLKLCSVPRLSTKREFQWRT
eukprot:SAG31_NODE_3661_length_4013_cov_2.518140_3_plen_114_part_00